MSPAVTTMRYHHKTRSYLHFDKPLSCKAAENLVRDPERVKSHSFYPFISYVILTSKIKKIRNEEGKRKIEKKEPKPRPIKIASHADAAIFSYYAQLLAEHYEKALENDGTSQCVAAFRSGRGTNMDTASEVLHFTSAPHCILTFDIEGFFDNLDHAILKTAWCDLLQESQLPPDHFALFKALTCYAEVDRTELYRLLGISIHNPKQIHLPLAERRATICSAAEFRTIRSCTATLIQRNSKGIGIPQGSPISAFLSNVYMRTFDRAVSQRISKEGGLYRRYCDDIAIVLNQTSNYQEIESFVCSEIQKLKLTINAGKTKRAAFPLTNQNGFEASIQYLGFTKNQQKILIREGSLSRYYGKMRRAVRLTKRSCDKHSRRSGIKLPLRTAKLFRQYSYLIRRNSTAKKFCQRDHIGNFITYAHKAAQKLNAPEIKQQVKAHWRKLKSEIRRSS